MASTGELQTIYGGILGIGKPSEYELMCRHRARLWEGLIPFVALFEEPDPKKKRPKPEYDYRVVVARAKEKERLCRQ